MSLITLHPGDIHFGGAPDLIQTLVGSCVCITLWHKKLKIGGMCHYVLPYAYIRPAAPLGHSAEGAVCHFKSQIQKWNCRPCDFEVHLFGGSSFWHRSLDSASPLNIAERNITAGEDLLRSTGFTIATTDTGGSFCRKIQLDLATGKTELTKTQPTENILKDQYDQSYVGG